MSEDPAHVDELARIRRQFWVALAIFALVVGPIAVIALRTAGRADKNTNLIADVERQDNIDSNRAQWRGCARDMVERADKFAGDIALARLPGLRAIIPVEVIERSVARRRRLLPLLNCDPNLCDGTPYAMSVRQQQQMVTAYVRGRLDSNPAPPRRHRCPVSEPPLQLR